MVPGAGAEGEAVLVQEDRGTQAVGTWGSYSTVLDITSPACLGNILQALWEGLHPGSCIEHLLLESVLADAKCFQTVLFPCSRRPRAPPRNCAL
jgi:hypothetical protein